MQTQSDATARIESILPGFRFKEDQPAPASPAPPEPQTSTSNAMAPDEDKLAEPVEAVVEDPVTQRRLVSGLQAAKADRGETQQRET